MILKAVDYLFYQMLGLDPLEKWVQVGHFFVYDTVKIFFLLFVLITVIGVLRSYLPASKIKKWMTGRGILGNVASALFGALTPFCSCSSIPIFLSFLKAGVPLGITFSFLIASPIINEYLVVLMLGYFGWKITVLYVLSGLLIGVVSGFILGKMNLEIYLADDFQDAKDVLKDDEFAGFRSRVRYGLNESIDIIKKVWMWILVGVGIGAFIHNFVPQEVIQGIISKTGIFSVPIATLLGVPMYGSCAAIVPIAVVLFQKGVPLGTALSFMMAIAALSLPEAVILRRAMKLKLIMIFFGVVTLGIIVTGFLFNYLQSMGI